MYISKQSPVPLYYQLKEIIKAEIEKGSFPPGGKIPTERELEKEFKVSRMTVRQAVSCLENEGLVERAHGSGTFVSKPKFQLRLNPFFSFTEEMRSYGYRTDSRLISLSKTRPTEKVAAKLDLDKDKEVTELKVLKLVEDEPVFLQTSYLPLQYSVDLFRETTVPPSLYRWLAERYGIEPARASETMETIAINQYEADILKTRVGSPGLLLERITYSFQGDPFEFVKSILKSIRFKIIIDLTGNQLKQKGGERDG
jgi:GntR family transcriptional regulator